MITTPILNLVERLPVGTIKEQFNALCEYYGQMCANETTIKRFRFDVELIFKRNNIKVDFELNLIDGTLTMNPKTDIDREIFKMLFE